MSLFGTLSYLRSACRKVKSPFFGTLIRHAWFRLNGRNLFTSNRVSIHGLSNILIDGVLRVGLDYVGFMDAKDRTLLRINGQLRVSDSFSIGKGCRLDIGKDAILTVSSGYINPNTTLVIMHGMTLGRGCAVSWGCQFLDEDFHSISFDGKKNTGDNPITVGDHVWIGSNVTVLKGSRIPSGTVVAAGSVVNAQFTEENTLIAGVPARVIRRNVSWA